MLIHKVKTGPTGGGVIPSHDQCVITITAGLFGVAYIYCVIYFEVGAGCRYMQFRVKSVLVRFSMGGVHAWLMGKPFDIFEDGWDTVNKIPPIITKTG